MKLTDVHKSIGRKVTISGGDIAIRSEVRDYVFNETLLTIVKVTKSGEVYLQHENDFVTVGAKYIHLCD